MVRRGVDGRRRRRDENRLIIRAAPAVGDRAGELVGNIVGVKINERRAAADQRDAVGADADIGERNNIAIRVAPVRGEAGQVNGQRRVKVVGVKSHRRRRRMIGDDLQQQIGRGQIVCVAGINGGNHIRAARQRRTIGADGLSGGKQFGIEGRAVG